MEPKGLSVKLIVAVVLVLTLAGCVPAEPPAATTPSPTAAPTATPTANPTSSETAAPIDPPSEPPLDNQHFVQICLERSTPMLAAPIEPLIADARVLRRDLPPFWLVYIPVESGNGPGAALCRFTDDPNDGEGSWGATIPLSEDQIQDLVESNDYWSL